MKTDQLVMHSLTTGQRNLEEALEAYAAAGFRHVELYLALIKAWLEDGHTVEQTRDLFDSYGLDLVGGSEAVPVECFHSPDVLLPSLRTHVKNLRLIHDLGGTKMIIATDGPEQVAPDSLEHIAWALRAIGEATEGYEVDIGVEFNASPVVKSLQSAVRVSEAIRYADRLGRRPLLLIGAIGTTLALGVLAITSLTTSEPTGIGPVGIITLICLGTYIFFFQGSWGSITWVLLGEIFPLGIRATAMGVATVALWSANFVVAFTFPPMLAALGVGWLFSIYAFICLGAFFFVWFLVPETKGRSLEKIETDLREAQGTRQSA